MKRMSKRDLGRMAGVRNRGFTLVELLVVVSIIALLISILLPSLKKAREQTKATVCLSNLRALGQGLMLYATEYDGRLPGPAHPALYRNQTTQNYLDQGFTAAQAKYAMSRQVSFMLSAVMNQKGGALRTNVSDGVANCPSLGRILSEEHFERYRTNTGKTGLFPFHYVLNNYGDASADPDVSGFADNPRKTNPPNYFGASPPSKTTFDQLVLDDELVGPTTLSRIARPGEEWAIGDAWYRPRISPFFTFLQQDGTYQSDWSGNVLPFAPPHRLKSPLTAFDTDSNNRQTAAIKFAEGQNDGYTQATYFDGHAAAVKSKSLSISNFIVFYGFPGTVNNDFRGIPDTTVSNFRTLVWK